MISECEVEQMTSAISNEQLLAEVARRRLMKIEAFPSLDLLVELNRRGGSVRYTTLNDYAAQVHANNKKWWVDLHTGEIILVYPLHRTKLLHDRTATAEACATLLKFGMNPASIPPKQRVSTDTGFDF